MVCSLLRSSSAAGQFSKIKLGNSRCLVGSGRNAAWTIYCTRVNKITQRGVRLTLPSFERRSSEYLGLQTIGYGVSRKFKAPPIPCQTSSQRTEHKRARYYTSQPNFTMLVRGVREQGSKCMAVTVNYAQRWVMGAVALPSKRLRSWRAGVLYAGTREARGCVVRRRSYGHACDAVRVVVGPYPAVMAGHLSACLPHSANNKGAGGWAGCFDNFCCQVDLVLERAGTPSSRLLILCGVFRSTLVVNALRLSRRFHRLVQLILANQHTCAYCCCRLVLFINLVRTLVGVSSWLHYYVMHVKGPRCQG